MRGINVAVSNKLKYGLGALILFILVAESVLTGLIPHSRGYLFHYLTLKTGPVYVALGIYFCNLLFLDFFQCFKAYFILKLSLVYRKIRTLAVLNNYKQGIINTEQRIQEDIKLSYLNRFTVWAEYFISGTIVIQLLIINLAVPLLVIAALIYAALSVAIAYKFNPRLKRAEKTVQQEEANFRESIVSSNLLCANQASIKAERIKTEYLLFTKLQLGLINILPYLILIPELLSGKIDLGTVVMHQATFSLIVVNAAILIQMYTVLIRGKASEERVKELE